ncbi:MAG: hypothetical protein V3U75_04690 [Methylococcaceae bacterium]
MKTFKALAYSFCFTSVLAVPTVSWGVSDLEVRELLNEVNELKREVKQLKSNQDRIVVQQKETVEEQRAEVEEVLEEVEATNSVLDYLPRVSGYADVEYKMSDKNGANDGFRIHHLSLFFTKQWSEKWRFFSEIEYEDGPKFEGDTADGKIFVEAVNIDYLWRPEAMIRLGRFFTPAGLWSVDHYPPFVPTQDRPLHVRKIFPQLIDGASVFGSFNLADTNAFLNYNVFVGNGEGNTGHNDDNSKKAVGGKLSFVLPFLDHAELGGTAYHDGLNNGDDKFAIGAHGIFKQSNFTLQGEYATANINAQSGSDHSDYGYYAQLFYDWSDFTFGGRHDFLDRKGVDRTRETLFLNYHVNSNLVLKYEQHWDDFDSGKEDSTSAIFSIVGYLD